MGFEAQLLARLPSDPQGKRLPDAFLLQAIVRLWIQEDNILRQDRFKNADKKLAMRSQMASIRVLDDGAPPIVEKGREIPFKQGQFYVFDVEDDVARYWNKLAPAKRAELSKQSRKTNKDLRLILDPFVHKPRTTK